MYNGHVHDQLTRNLVFTAILALACAVVLSACGSSRKMTAAKSPTDPRIAFATCMRAHGVTNFPDPSEGGGRNLDSTGINLQSPSFRAARATCFKLIAPSGPANQQASARQIKQALQTAECMRAHGVTGFPDPVVSTSSGPPNINPARYSSVEDMGGIIIAIPKSVNEQSPTFVAAAKTCHLQ